jgi:putative ATP-dependent endonuclease of OLD family
VTSKTDAWEDPHSEHKQASGENDLRHDVPTATFAGSRALERGVQLESISVEGFRSLGDLPRLNVGSPTLLTGHNDAGKSALIDAIRYLLNEYDLTPRDPTFAQVAEEQEEESSRKRVGKTCVAGVFATSAEEQADLGLPAQVSIRRLSASGAAALYEIESTIADDERLRDLDLLTVPELKERANQLGLKVKGTAKADYLEPLKAQASTAPSTVGWVQAAPNILKALPTVLRFNPSGETDAEETIRGALLASFKIHEKNDLIVGDLTKLQSALEEKIAADAADLREHIMKTIPDIGKVTIIPSVSFSSGLKNTQVSVTNPAGEAVQLGEAGAGRARRVSLAVWEFTTGLLSKSGDMVILYDEPDTHLDYAHQRSFMALVDHQTSLPRVRMVIATHSMNLIDGVDIADVVLLEHDETYRTIAKVLADDSEVGEHLGAIAASLGLRNTVLLNERLFVGVEGATEAGAFPVLFRLATGKQLQACGIALWSCNNNEGALKFASYLNDHHRDVVFVVDQDSKKTSKHLFNTKKLAQYGLSEDKHGIYLGHPNELEDIFDDAIWARTANDNWPRPNGIDWTESEISALRLGKFSSSLLELFKEGSETGPQNKQELVTTLALALKNSSEIPLSLIEAFQLLVDRAKV